MISAKELRKRGRGALRDHWGIAIVTCIVMHSVMSLFYIPFMHISYMEEWSIHEFWRVSNADLPWHVGNWLQLVGGILVTGALSMIGISYFFLRLNREHEKADITDLFISFRSGESFLKSVGYYLLYSIYISLWMLLLLIPGIIKTYSYALSPYLLADHPEMGVNQAITRSRELMRGNKFKLFALQLSFIGWFILSIFPLCGFGFIWLTPYYRATEASFYQEIIGSQDS